MVAKIEVVLMVLLKAAFEIVAVQTAMVDSDFGVEKDLLAVERKQRFDRMH